MGKGPLKDNANLYFQARKKAAEWDERLFSRERAADLLGISPYTLADYELGNTKVVPVDKVLLMADLYNAPELITGYCKFQCPIHGFMPLATEDNGIQGITLKMIKAIDVAKMREALRSLIEIAADGTISDDEIPVLKVIVDHMDDVVAVASELKLAVEKVMKGGGCRGCHGKPEKGTKD